MATAGGVRREGRELVSLPHAEALAVERPPHTALARAAFGELLHQRVRDKLGVRVLVSLGVVEMTYRASARNEFSQQLAQQFIAAMTPGGVALLQGHARRKLCDQSHMLGMECSPAAVQAVS
eukprot:CAMPEP_0182805270 /NCGR_PEP_ID=MMETSP0006_2-20121128/4986_1 /TAXON_ID=97485 /ORGANISM="Prymnesium parvum, Strain Texoma1" /LENGTH=121 /DNA_ID=CAMNT_0024930827 /DNA_START=563 /DNA_END=928 /DNA_ORIENTATION=+